MESLFYDPKHGLGSMIKFAAKARQAGFKNDESVPLQDQLSAGVLPV